MRRFRLRVDGVGGFLKSETPIVTEEDIFKKNRAADPDDWCRIKAVEEIDEKGNVIKLDEPTDPDAPTVDIKVQPPPPLKNLEQVSKEIPPPREVDPIQA